MGFELDIMALGWWELSHIFSILFKREFDFQVCAVDYIIDCWKTKAELVLQTPCQRWRITWEWKEMLEYMPSDV